VIQMCSTSASVSCEDRVLKYSGHTHSLRTRQFAVADKGVT
jgi:hypothetical protein